MRKPQRGQKRGTKLSLLTPTSKHQLSTLESRVTPGIAELHEAPSLKYPEKHKQILDRETEMINVSCHFKPHICGIYYAAMDNQHTLNPCYPFPDASICTPMSFSFHCCSHFLCPFCFFKCLYNRLGIYVIFYICSNSVWIPFKKYNYGPGRFGSVDWASGSGLKGPKFNSQSVLWALSLVWGRRQLITDSHHWCF